MKCLKLCLYDNKYDKYRVWMGFERKISNYLVVGREQSLSIQVISL